MNKKPIKLCFVSPKVYPLFNPSVEAVFGGAEVDLYMLGTELAEDKDFEISFITADYGQPRTEAIRNIKIIRGLSFKDAPLISAIKIWRSMKKADADIYMLETASPGVPLVWLFCRLNQRLFIYRTAHQDECDGTYMKKHYLLGRAFVFSLRRADFVVSQNVCDRQLLQQTAGIDSAVVPNAHRRAQTQELNRDIILWVGRSADFKQPYKFIELAGRFPFEHFVMICQQASGDIDYQRLVQMASVVPNVEFHQRVGFDRIDVFFARAKVFINTSIAEGFPNTFIQACSAGTAILSLAVDPDGFLEKNSCGINCRGDQTTLTEQLIFLLAENRYLQFGLNGRKYVAQNHDIDKVIGQYRDIFSKIAASADNAG